MTSCVSGIELQIADGQIRLAARRAAPQQGPEPGEQLLALERLDEVVVGARVESLDARLDRVARGQHEDRHVVLLAAQLLGDVEAVHPRQAKVEDHEIGQEPVRLVERHEPVLGDADLVALHPQRALEHLGDRVVVLDDEHAGWTFEISHCCRRWYVAATARPSAVLDTA